MENIGKIDSPETDSQVINITTSAKKNKPAIKLRSTKRKWVILALVFLLAVAPAVFILFRLLVNKRTEQKYEDCIRECVVSKNSGETDDPYRNCFEYCKK